MRVLWSMPGRGTQGVTPGWKIHPRIRNSFSPLLFAWTPSSIYRAAGMLEGRGLNPPYWSHLLTTPSIQTDGYCLCIDAACVCVCVSLTSGGLAAAHVVSFRPRSLAAVWAYQIHEDAHPSRGLCGPAPGGPALDVSAPSGRRPLSSAWSGTLTSPSLRMREGSWGWRYDAAFWEGLAS